MADQETNTGGGDGGNDTITTLDALHLDGKGAPTLDGADERTLTDDQSGRGDDVAGNANVQSADRVTFERMVDNGIREARAMPTADNIVVDVVTPTERDNTVNARFDNIQPAFQPAAQPPEAPAPAPQQPPVTLDPTLTRDPPALPGTEGDTQAPPAAPTAPVAAPIVVAPLAVPTDTTAAPETPTTTIRPEHLADQPLVITPAASGTEDLDTRLTLTVATNDRDGGSESLTAILIGSVPDGFSFVNSAGNAIGIPVGGGIWSFTADDLADLYLRQPANYSGEITLTLSATSAEAGGGTATTTTTFTVDIAAVADAPTLVVQDSAGMENALISLDIDVANNDAVVEGIGANAPETQTVYIAGLPDGARLVLDGDTVTTRTTADMVVDGVTIPAESYVVGAADAARLMVQSATNDSADFTLEVWSTSTEASNGDVAISGPQTITVDVGVVGPAVPDTTATAAEDAWTRLDVQVTVNADMAATNTNGDESLSVYVENLPDGVTLRDATTGQVLPTTRHTDASGTVHTGYDVSAYTDSTGHLTGLEVRWTAENVSDAISFTLRAVVADQDRDDDSAGLNGGTTTIVSLAPDMSDATGTVTITYDAVADAPTVAAHGIVVEDKWADLSVSAGLGDTDGSETLTVSVTGASGFSLRVADGAGGHTLLTGTDNGDGTTTYLLSASQLATVQLKAAPDSDADLTLTLTAIATEGANGDTATTATTIVVPVLSDADTPTISVVDAVQTVAEDGFYNLRTAISGDASGNSAATQAALGEGSHATDAATSDDGSERLTSVTLTARQDSRVWVDADHDDVVDAGEVTTLGAGQSVTLAAADVLGGHVSVGGVADWASANGADDLRFDISVTATETNGATDEALAAANGLTRATTATSATDTLTLHVTPVGDAATLTAGDSMFEDGLAGLDDNGADTSGTAHALTITVTTTDTDGSEQPGGTVTLTSTSAGMIGGTLAFNGVALTPVYTHDGGGAVTAVTYTFQADTTDYTETSANVWSLDGLTFLPAADYAGTVTYDLTVTTHDSETAFSRALTLDGAAVTVTAVADMPTLEVADVNLVETAGTNHVALTIDVTGNDADGSETQFVYVTGAPAAAGTLSSYVEKVTSGTFTVDGVTFTATADMPVYKVAASALSGLTLDLVPGYSDDMTLTVHAVSVENSNGDVAIGAAQTIDVEIGIQDPVVTVGTLTTTEDTYYALSGITVSVPAHDPTDTVTITIDGLTPGFALYQSDGHGGYVQIPGTGGVYTIDAGLVVGDTLAGVYIKGIDNSDADATFSIHVTDTDADIAQGLTADAQGTLSADGVNIQDTVTVSQTVTVTVAAVADAPSLTAAGAIVEDQWGALSISTALTDGDGSETLSAVTITGHADFALRVADGAGGHTLLTGTDNGDGTVSYVVPLNQLAGLQVKATTANSDTDLSLTVSVSATESSNGDTATTTKVVTVPVLSDADAPTISVVDGVQVIDEDAFYNLRGTVSATDSSGNSVAVEGALGEPDANGDGTSDDGSESLTYTITAKQASRVWVDADHDGIVAAGEVTTLAANQSITVSAAALQGGWVSVGGVANWASTSDTLSFDIVATATEANGATDTGLAGTYSLSRGSTATSAVDTLVLSVTPLADATTITATGGGQEDASAIALAVTVKLTDTDGSEQLTGSIQVLVKGDMDGHLRMNGVTLAAQDANTDGVADTVTVDGVVYAVYNVAISDGMTGLSFDSATGTYRLTGLTYVPDPDSDANLVYRIRTTTIDDGGSTYVTTSDEGTLVVKAVADAPLISVDAHQDKTDVSDTTTAATTLTVTEDQYLHLSLSAALSDIDGSESLSTATLSDVPSGWTVVYWDATSNAYVAYSHSGSTWYLNTANLGNVYLLPAKNSDADASTIVFSVTSTEAATGSEVAVAQATTSLAFDVVVVADADTPTLLVNNAVVKEDEVVKLDIRAAATDTDGSETVTVTISGTNGGTFFMQDASGAYVAYSADHHNADGTWTFSASEVGNLYFQPKAQSNVDVTLSVTAISTEASNHDAASTTQDLYINVIGVADPASVGVNADAITATGTEDTRTAADGTTLANTGAVVDLNLEAHVSVDTDGSEALSAVISNVPSGVTVFLDLDNDGTMDVGEDNSAHLKYIGGDSWSVAPEYLKYVKVLTPENYSGSFDLSVKLITTENDGDYETVATKLTVTVAAVADTPSGSISGTATEDGGSATSDDGTSLSFTLNASVTDTGGGNAGIGDGGVETVSSVSHLVLDVTDLVQTVQAAGGSSADVHVTYNGATVPALQVGGVWTITIETLAIPAGQTSVTVGGLVLYGIPGDYSTDVSASMVVATSDGGTSAQATVSGELKILPSVDAPTFTVTGSSAHPVGYVADASDTHHTVTLADNNGNGIAEALVAVGDDSESVSYVVISGVPNGVIVVGGHNNGDGTWTVVNSGGGSLEQIQLVATDSIGATGTAAVTVTAYIADTDVDGDSASAAFTSHVVNVDFGSFSGGSGGGGSDTIPVGTITGSLVLTEDTPLNLDGLKALISVVNEQGTASTADDVTLTVGADGTCADGSTISLVVVVPPGWSIGGSGYYLIASADTDGDGVADTSTYTVPYGSLGSVTLTPPADYSGDTSGLQMRVVVTTADGAYDEAAAALSTLPATILPDADTAVIAATSTAGVEDGANATFALTIGTGDIDNAGAADITSEDLAATVTIRVYDQDGASPGTLVAAAASGYTLSAGTHVAAGYTEYTLTLSDVSAFQTAAGVTIGGLSFKSDTDFSGTVNLSVTVTTTDTATNTVHGADGSTSTQTNTDSATTTANFSLTVTPAVDATVYTVHPVTTDEDTSVALDVSLTHADLAGSGAQWSSETMSVVISGVPDGATLSGAYNNGDGTWTVYDSAIVRDSATGAYTLNVGFTPAADDAHDVTLTVITYTREAGTSAWVADTSQDVTVTVTAVADGASINPQAVSGTEDHMVALALNAEVLDARESAQITITGMPAGSALVLVAADGVTTTTLNTNASGVVVLTADQVSAYDLLGDGTVYFANVAHLSGTWTLSASIHSVATDPDTLTQAASAETGLFTFTVTQAAEADAPTLTLVSSTVDATEDQAVSLDLGATLVDTDGSEALSLTISGAPAGTSFTVTYGDSSTATYTVGASGTVSFGDGTQSIAGVTMTPPRDYNGALTLGVTATATESSNGSTATTTRQITVDVAAVDDAPVLSGTAGLGVQAGAHTQALVLVTNTGALSATDVENDHITQMSVSIDGGKTGDALGLSGLTPTTGATGETTVTVGGDTFTIAYQQGALVFSSATATAGEYLALLASVVFTSTTGTLLAGTRTVEVTLTDAGGATSDPLGISVTVAHGGATLSGNALGDVTFTNSAPTATAIALTTSEDSPLTFTAADLLATAADVNADTLTVTAISASHGTVTQAADGTYTYTPAADYVGAATLTYTIADGEGGSVVVTSPVTVTSDLTAADTAQTIGAAVTDPILAIPAQTDGGATNTVTLADDFAASTLTVHLDGARTSDTLGLAGHDIALNTNYDTVVAGTDVTVSYDAANQTLTFNGASDGSDATTLVGLAQSVVLTSTDRQLDAGTRTLTMTLYDDGGDKTSLTTSVDVTQSATLSDQAQGSVFWSGTTPVINGTDGDDSISVQFGGTISVDGGAGIDALVASGIADWTLDVSADHTTIIASWDSGGDAHSAIIHLDDTTAATAVLTGDAQGVVFNSSASGTITFDDDSVLTFQNLEKISHA